MKTGRLPHVILLAALLLPWTASANAGTPLMWAGLLHMWVGNAVIGVAEGLLLALCFNLRGRRCVPLMIMANYTSAWIGWVGLVALSDKLNWNLYNAWRQFWWLVGAAYVLTLLLEWPFVAGCFWRQANWLKRSIRASLIVQTLSYLLLFGWYWGASGTSLYTELRVVSPAEMQLPAGARLFFIGSKDGRLYEMDLDSKRTRIVGEVVSTNRDDRLLFRAVPTNTQHAELCLHRGWEWYDVPRLETLARPFWSTNVWAETQDDWRRNLWMSFGRAAVLRSATNSGVVFWTGFWAREGLKAWNAKEGVRFRAAWETPFSRWMVRAATHLPGDQVIFQLGEDQICLLDAPTRRIARIAEGRSPVVALKDAEASAR